jgi:hypothetical protein
MTEKEIEKLLQEYPRLTAKIFNFNQDYRRLIKEKEAFLHRYPQFSENAVRTSKTYNISDPTFDTVCKALEDYDRHVQHLAERLRECIAKRELIESLFGVLEPLEYDVIDYYYFRGLRPNYIALKLYISRATFFRLKKQAIWKMAKASEAIKLG